MKSVKKINKILLSFILSIITVAALSLSNFVQAANAGPLYLGIELYRNSGYAYRQGQLEIFKILSYTSTDKTSRVQGEKTIYCIKGGAGFGSATPSTTGAIAYTNKFDLKNVSAIPSPYKDVLPTGENYNKLMWVLDHLFIMPENPQEDNTAEREAFLSKVIPEEFYEKLTNDDIDVVQQMAIWYFTNPNDNWHFGNANLKMKKSGEEYESIFNIDEDRDDAITALYDYYITSAQANYVSPTVATNAKPIQIEDKSNGKMQTIGANYVAGPYQINQVLDLGYEITEVKYNDGAITPTIGVKNQSGDIVSTNKTIKDLVGQEFYLIVPTSSDITQLTMKISGKYTVRQEWYWSTETDLENNQPVVIVEEEDKPFEDAVAAKVENKKVFDMALRKFITEINGKRIEELGLTSRVPTIEGLEALKNGTSNTAIYKHLKTPVKVNIGDIVTYTIRVYNEGELDGYVTEITDHLPAQLEYLMNDSTNLKYGWKYEAGDTHTIKTNFLSNADGTTSENPENNKIAAFNGTKLDYRDVQIRCKVVETANMPKKITNIADITGCKDSEGNVITNPSTGERDSTVKNVTIPTDLPSYKDQEINRQDPTDPDYIPGQEDDDDFEKLILKEFDLSLKKFITAVNDTEITNRDPQVDVSPLKGTGTTAKYTYKISPEKNPVVVENSDTVTYTIRVYNEGEASGYADKIRDDIPTGLEFLPDNSINTEYRWKMYDENNNETIDVSKAKTIATDYLSKAQEEATGRTNLLNAFEMTNTTLDYKDVKVAFKVIEPNSSKNIIINKAQIAEDSGDDRDSTPDEWIDGEDDQDIEKIRLKEFDLSLKKFITAVNDTEITNRDPQVDVAPLKNGQTTAKYTYKITPEKNPVVVENSDIVTYTIRVYNEGEVSGYAEKIRDDIPAGLEFLPDNSTNTEYRWKMYDENNNETTDVSKAKTIATDYLSKAQEEATGRTNLLNSFSSDKDTLDYKDVKVAFKVIEPNSSKNIIINKAQIAEDSSDDRDSTPDKWIEGEDDQDIEKIRLKEFDLSLKKFITKLNDENVTNRDPQVDVTPLKNGQTTAKYTYKISPEKNPLVVENSDIVTYTIRIYNEGEVSGYAEKIRDDIPAGLEFLPDNSTNIEYRWKMYDENNNEITDVSKAKTIATDYLSKAQEDETGRTNLLNAFGSDKDTLDYKDVKVAFKVIEPNSSKNIITNKAQIAEDSNDDRDSTPDEWIEGEDDQDIEKIRLKDFDLALRKYVTKVNEKEIKNRVPQVELDSLKTGTTATYNHTKLPLSVYLDDVVEYTIRVYNEGDSDGYVTEITDYLPKQLEFLTDNQTNIDNNWKMYDENDKETTDASKAVKIKTDKLKDEKIVAFDGNTLAYKEVKAVCKVVETENMVKKITNIAEISKCENSNRVEVKGKDSGDERDSNPNKVNVPTGTELENYKDDEIDKDYVPGQEDDDDFEKLILKEFDLSLRKFITAVNDTEITNREPKVDVTPLKDGSETTAKYEHSKDPVLVSNGNVVEYTIRVYNEGSVSGYAKEVKDDIPEGLEFLPENETNKEYRWIMLDDNGEETTDVSKAKTIATDYLSKEQEKTAGANLIKAFDPDTMDTLDYKDVKIAFKVIEPTTSDRVIINKAQISKNTDEGNEDVKDKDSTPDKWIEGEDDQDIEKVKVQYFDLSLRKWVTQSIVIEDGQEKITETGHTAEDDPEAVAKVDLKKSKIDKVTVKFRFKIRVKNEGTIAGYAKEIKDYIPDGLKFVEEDNPLWKKVDEKTITTDQCKDKLLKPGDTTEVEVVLTWINGEDNMGVMDNWAEISKDYNEYGSPDIDSTPDNNKKGEDDIDDAPVMVTVQTGEIAKYTGISIVVLAILTTGVVLIKKYVLN